MNMITHGRAQRSLREEEPAEPIEWRVHWYVGDYSTTDIEQTILATDVEADDMMFVARNNDDTVMMVPTVRLISVIRVDAIPGDE
jgi:hypothetical protein